MNAFTRMSFIGQVSFSGALWGFVEQWQGNPYRWRVLAVSVVLTTAVLYGFIPKSERAPPESYEVTYISTFEDGRSDEEIAESNLANQKVQDEYQAIRDRNAQAVKDAAETLGRATGVNVDRMKADAAREKAAAERDREQRRAELIAQAADRKARNGAVAD